MNQNRSKVLVIGGGLAGLACATLLARQGRDVRLLERASTLGGRASTDRAHGYSLNRGPHALYRGGHARDVLDELGVDIQGRRPPSAGLALHHGEIHTLPGTPWTLLRTRLLRPRDKLRLARWMSSIPRLDASSLSSFSASAWLAGQFEPGPLYELATAIVRLSTYASKLDQLSADAVAAQLALALTYGVDYIDGGWQTLVDGAASTARRDGVAIETGAPVRAIVETAMGVRAQLDDGRALESEVAVLAGGPGLVRALVPSCGLDDGFTPVAAACLDLGLSRLPVPGAPSLALGLDLPLYYGVHSATAQVAPEGGATIHAAHYGAVDDARERIESMLDQIQPGWRAHVVTERYLPRMVVAHDMPHPSRGGLSGRHDARLSPTGRLWAVGDWVGPRGLLLDAALASAREVATRIAAGRAELESEAA